MFGLRTIAGPLAGSLDMEWKVFAEFNVLGAATRVSVVGSTGFAFANEFDTLLGYMEKGSWAMAAGLFPAGYWIWHRQKRNYKNRQHKKAA